MPKKQRKKHRRVSIDQYELEHLHDIAANNVVAIQEGPSKKTWTKHDLLPVQPLTENQRTLFQAYFQGSHLVAHGLPGTGKTFLGLYLAFQDIVNPNMPQHKIRVVRSAVQTREIGHLPGSIEEKMSAYESPYISICKQLFGRPNTYADMKEERLIEFVPSSFVRGETWDNTIVVIDEAQNMTWHELNSIITRLGDDSRLIITGDSKQCDLTRKNDISGFEQLLRVANYMKSFAAVQFTSDDIVRSGFVRDWIVACEKLDLL